MKKLAKAVIPAIALILAGTAQADLLGGFNGRTVNSNDNQGMAVEAFYKSFAGSSMGVRASYRYSDDILVYGNYSKFTAEIDESLEAEGAYFGGGLIYMKSDLISGFDTAFKLSYNTGNIANDSVTLQVQGINVTGLNIDQDDTELSAEFIISSDEPIMDNGLKWYAGLSFHQLKSEGQIGTGGGGTPTINGVRFPLDLSESGTEVGYSVGLVYPLAFGEAYLGYENVDGAIYGGGIRYAIK